MATKAELEQELLNKDEALKQMQEQMKKMEEMMKQFMSQPKSTTVEVTTEEKLKGDDLIPVMSLTEGQLNISTEKFGQGDTFTFENRGEITDIYYDALTRIVQNNKSFTHGGKFYIMDERAVKKLRLEKIYEDILTPETLDTFLDMGAEKVCNIYENATKGQQEIIKDIIIKKKFAHEYIDANIMFALDQKFGLGLMQIENPLDIPTNYEK